MRCTMRVRRGLNPSVGMQHGDRVIDRESGVCCDERLSDVLHDLKAHVCPIVVRAVAHAEAFSGEDSRNAQRIRLQSFRQRRLGLL